MKEMRLFSLFFTTMVLGFICCSNGIALETRIAQPSLSVLSENFRSEKDTFKKQAKAAIQELEKFSNDDAVLASLRLKRNLQTIEMLDYLIVKCKDESKNPPIKQETKAHVQEICRYLVSIAPYAGKMQEVITAVLQKEFGVDTVSQLLEAIAN